MGSAKRAVHGDIAGLPAHLRDSTLAQVCLDLAKRLDAGPADTAAVLVARELRLALAELRQLAKDEGGDDLEGFLERISAPSLGDGAHGA